MPALGLYQTTITAPGEYWLEQDQYRPGGYALSILADNVRVNLNGHYFGGYGICGINSIGRSGISVVDGYLWGDWIYSIRIEGASTYNNYIRNIECWNARVVGISIDGVGGLVYECRAHGIGHPTSERAYAYALGGTGHRLAYCNAWSIKGRLESLAVSTVGSGHAIYGCDFHASGSEGSDWYAAWSNADADQYSSNIFRGGYGGIASAAAGTEASSTQNQFDGVTAPYLGDVKTFPPPDNDMISP